MTPGERDSFFLSSVYALADRHGAQIVDIDLEGRVLEFDCDDDEAFAVELGDLFSEYLI